LNETLGNKKTLSLKAPVSLPLTPPQKPDLARLQVIIPAGLLVDNNFMITASGEAIWAPNGKRPGS
jgi:hypothetical protein